MILPLRMNQPMSDKIVSDPDTFFTDNDHQDVGTEAMCNDMEFSENDIKEAIKALSPNSSPGPEAFPAKLLINCSDMLVHPLYMIFRISLDKGEIPNILKQAVITPIHKGESKAVPKNYRPVSLTSHITKTFERVIRTQLVDFLEENHLFNDSQHGFRKGRSCLSQLLNHYDKIVSELEKGYNVDVVYLDFAKAFDKVDHGILCHKLKKLGISGKIGRWIHNFLSGRTQSVSVNGIQSKLKNVKSSVPQGTVLGPILFLILLLDIDVDITSTVSSFADDTRISRSIHTIDDTKLLQKDLERSYEWQRKNNMLFNEKKFELLRYGMDQTIKGNTYYTGPQGNTIEEKTCLRDLGVQLSNTAKFDDHINTVCKKANKMCGWIHRTFKTRNAMVMRQLWTSLIQPHYDYCSQLWAPYRVGQIQKLEGIQRQYTHRIANMDHMNYWERLLELKMNSQERRMERYRIIYVWKILEGRVPNPGINSHITLRKGRLCKIPALVTQARESIKTLKDASFAVRGPKLFNFLPQNIRDKTGCSVESFKNILDQYLRDIPDQPRLPGYPTNNASNSILDMALRLEC